MASSTAWHNFPARQQPQYADSAALEKVITEIHNLPPLVPQAEIDELTSLIAASGRGEVFLLQGGDCAETFVDSSPARIRAKLQTLQQMALVLNIGTSLPVVKVGRIAGQYAKPRSLPTEIQDGIELPSYRGDAVNGFAFTRASRSFDPERLLEAYRHAAKTLHFIHNFAAEPLPDWHYSFLPTSNSAIGPLYSRYQHLMAEIAEYLRQNPERAQFSPPESNFYSAHEALLLRYEEALTRCGVKKNQLYNFGAHFLWIGERTRNINEAHVEMLSHISNPIGVKIGPKAQVEEVLALIEKLNPQNQPGRLSLIMRLGAKKISALLPPLIEAVQREGKVVTWISDPMHGNTISACNGYKTRRMQDIWEELYRFFQIHFQLGTVPGGIHIELTSDDVTEVLGGAEKIDEDILATRYEALVDPRLNRRQSLETAFRVAEIFREFAQPNN